MNNEMPEEIYVFPDTEGEKDDFWAKPVAPEYDYGFKDQTRYIRADKAVPEGFKLVPIEPTKEMIWSGIENTEEFVNGDPWYGSEPLSDGQAEQCYKAMLSAAPQPPTKGD